MAISINDSSKRKRYKILALLTINSFFSIILSFQKSGVPIILTRKRKKKKNLHEKYRKASLSFIKVLIKLIRKLTTIGKPTFCGHSPSAKKQKKKPN